MQPHQLASLLRPKFSVLAGAGISYAAPSCLPYAGAVLRSIIHSSSIPLPRAVREELLAAISPEWPLGLTWHHFLRFEQIVEALQLTVDPDLAVIAKSLPHTVPNSYHYCLASLLEDGHPVLTTNFDTLIEQACRDLEIEYSLVLGDEDYAKYALDPEAFPNPLFKLHGSLSTGNNEAEQPIATISAVTCQLMDAPSKWHTVMKLFHDHDVLVIGYSGSDDFDLMPSIKSGNKRRLVWIFHQANGIPVLHSGMEGPSSLLGIADKKLALFFRRMFTSLEAQLGLTHGQRRVEDTFIVRGETVDILQLLGIDATERQVVGDQSVETALIDLSAGSQGALHLFAGRILDAIGLWHPGCKQYESAAELLDTEENVLLSARANAWIARIYAARSKNRLAIEHEETAWRLYERVDTLLPHDRRLLAQMLTKSRDWEVSLALNRSSTLAYRAPTHIEFREDLSVQVERWLVDFQQLIAERRTEEAATNLQRCRKWLKSVGPVTQGRILYFCAAHADFNERWSSSNTGKPANVARGELDHALRIFEEHQDYQAWADAWLLAAESERNNHGLAVEVYNCAREAFLIYSFIANDFDARYAAELMAEASEILHNMPEDLRAELDIATRIASPDALRRCAEQLGRRYALSEYQNDRESCELEECLFPRSLIDLIR